jgi:uncharacterized protein (TIGR03435 family)
MPNRILACSLLSALPLLPQTASLPAFDAAEIKLVRPEPGARVSDDYQHGRFVVHNATLQMLIASAYNTRTDLVVGGPAWVATDHFDVSAKTEPTTPATALSAMLRALIDDRFELRTHHEQREVAVYALMVGKSGPKLQPTPEPSSVHSGCRGTPLACYKVSIPALAQMIPRMAPLDIDRPVVDLTAIEGYYDIKLASGPGRSIFDTIEELGLQLEPRKQPVDYTVIDHVERLPE